MKMSLLPHLVCPQCGGALRIDVPRAENEEVYRGRLHCDREEHRYEIDGGVPVLLPADLSAAQKQVASSYSSKWRRIPGYGYDSASLQFQRDWYLQKFGWGTANRFEQFLQGKARVLDAGCGLGRDVKFYAENTRGLVFGVDITDSVMLAREKLRHMPNVHLVQADLTRLPFRHGYFDFIASDQALHHTPDTHNSFRQLLSHLAPQGQIAIYVYKRKGPAREHTDDLIRRHTTEMSYDDCVAFASACALFGKTVSELNLALQRDIYWGAFKCFWSSAYDTTTNVLINLDWYHPKYAWRHTPGEIKAWCEDAGVSLEHFDVCDSGISVRGQR